MVLYRVSYINHCQDFRRKVGVRGEGGGGKGESEEGGEGDFLV